MAERRKLGEHCVHFTGLMSKHCKMSVRYENVRERTEDGTGPRIPCIQGAEGSIECPFRQFPTPEQIAEREAYVRDFLERLVKATNGELMECLVCRAPVERYKEVRPCVYAEPCGHRQWQGTAPQVRA